MNAQHRLSFSQLDFPSGDKGRVAEPAADDRRLTSHDVKRFLAGFFFVVVCVGIAWPLLPRRYESTASVILRPTDAQGRLDSIESLRQPLDDNAIQSEMDIIGSPTVASTVIAQHQLQNDPEFAGDPSGWNVRLLQSLYRVVPVAAQWFGDLRKPSEAAIREQLQKHLTVSRDRRSYTVKMGYWSSDPVKAAALTDTLLNAYLSNQLARKRGSADQHSAWLIERVEGLQARYEKTERAAREFSLNSDLTDGAMLNSLESQRAALSQEAAELRGKIAASAMLSETITAQRTKAPSSGPAAAGAMLPPQTQSAESRNSELRLAVVEKALRTIREEISDRDLAAHKLDALKREAAIDKELLDRALVRLKEQEPRTSSAGPGVEILARPDAALRPSFPNALLFLAGTLIAALAAGAAMVWYPRPRDARLTLDQR